MTRIDPFQRELESPHHEFHAASTISLGELIDWGWIDWDADDWKFELYNEETHDRICKKIEARYWMREIGILPPGEWRRRFLGLIEELRPKYEMLYKRLEDGLNPFQSSDEYFKERNIFSEFPQTSLGGNQDYASNGNDREYEKIVEGDAILNSIRYKDIYKDADAMFLDELDVLFSSLISMNLNGY